MNKYQQLLDQIAAAGGDAAPQQKSEEKPSVEVMLDLLREAAAQAGFDVTVIGGAELEVDEEVDEEVDASECPVCGNVRESEEEEGDGFSDEFIGTLQQLAMEMAEVTAKFKEAALKAIIAELDRMRTIERPTDEDFKALFFLGDALEALKEGNPAPLLNLL